METKGCETCKVFGYSYKASVEALNFYVEDMLKIKNKDDALQAYYIFANGIASPQKLL